jgi:methyl-accepting chemotaxis protein
MAENVEKERRRRGLSLSLLISLGLVTTTIIPLLITLSYILWQTRPALIDQANNAMTSDAQTRVQIIDTFFHERLLDAKTVTQVASLQSFLTMPATDMTDPFKRAAYSQAALHASYALQAGLDHNADYSFWAIFDANGQLRLEAPQGKTLPKRGNNYYSPDQLKEVKAGKSFISPVFYDATTHQTSVDIFAPVIPLDINGNPLPALGFARATLNLTTIQNVVKQETNVHGQGSYAFILDDQGVRIADSTGSTLFTSVAQLAPDMQQQVKNGERYTTQQPIITHPDPTIAAASQHNTPSETFQTQPAGANEQFEVVRQSATEVPWQYFVLSPVNAVTDTANKQVYGIFALMAVMTLIVAIAGIFTGRRITRPILQAVELLKNNSEALSSLSASQQDAATEQIWVVDSSQVGLQSVQYYTEATKTAAQKLRDAAQELRASLPATVPQPVDKSINNIFEAATYIERATELQISSNQKLATALKVATQVTEQLHKGATSAAEAATHLEEVVQDLRAVVGR